MKKAIPFTVLALGLCGFFCALHAQTAPVTTQSLNKMPLAFTKNMGQWDEQVQYRTSSGGATIWICKDKIVYQFLRTVKDSSKTGALRGLPDDPMDRFSEKSDSVEQLVITAKFVGANPNVEVVGEELMVYRCNYFFGSDQGRWQTDVPNYETITLKDIYSGIDLKYSGDGNGQVAFEYVVAPGMDIAQIKVEYEGVEETSIDADGRLILKTIFGDMIAAMMTPTNGVLSGACSFSQISERTNGLGADGATRRTMGTSSVGLVYSTYLGGGGDDQGWSVAVDVGGNAYVTGRAESSDFPTQNYYQSNQGYADVFVTKFSSSGNSLIYSTYIGGGNVDDGYGITVDNSGNAYVTGYTSSSDFPTQNPFQEDQGITDAFVCRLSSSGSSLDYSTFLGGSDLDFGEDIAVDNNGSVYVAGHTSSSDFPTLNPYQANQGGCDAFVTKLSSAGSSLIYSTYLGGSGEDWCFGMTVDGGGNAYITGRTLSSNFPTLSPYQTFLGDDVFVSKLSGSGNSLIYSTYLGGSSTEYGLGIAVDGSGNAYVTGTTFSYDFPILNPYQPFQGPGEIFVTKLSSSGSNLSYSIYLGGGSDESGTAIAVDGIGIAYVVGHTYSSNFPTQNPYQSHQGNYDVAVVKLSSSGSSLVYSTYLGGSSIEYGLGIAVDGTGNAYVTGSTFSSNFPTQNAYQTYHGGEDAFVTKITNPVQVNSFVHLSDPHVGASGAAERFQQMIDQINCLFPRPDFVIITGDLVDVGNASLSWLRFDEYCNQFLMPCYAVVGNHDHFLFNPLLPMLWPYMHYFSNYSVPMDGVQLVGLNSGANTDFVESQWPFYDELPEGSGLSEDTWDFMQEKLDEYPASKQVVAMHHPVRYNGSSGLFPGEEETNGCITSHLDDFINLCRSEGVSLVLGGHTHRDMLYTMSTTDHIQQLADNPPGGYWSTNSVPALPIYVVGDACGQNMAYRLIEKNGDAFEVHKTKRINSAYNKSLVTYVAGVRALDAGYEPNRVRNEFDSLTMPLQAHLYDSQGNHVGLNSSGTVDFEIPGAYYATGYIPTDTLDSTMVVAQEIISILEDSGEDYVFHFEALASCTVGVSGSFVDAVEGEKTQVYYPALGLDSGAVGFVNTSADSLGYNIYIDDDGDGTADRIILPDSVAVPYICGDANGSGVVNISDVVYLINYIFAGGPAPNPILAGDANCSGGVNISDAVYLINYIFAGGAAPCAACP